MSESDSVAHVAAAQRTVADPANPGVVREQAFAMEGLWAGIALTQPGMDSGWHHHGEYESVVFVLSGALRMESGPGGLSIVDAKAGDFLYVPAGAIHREQNTGDRESEVVVMRAGHGSATVNVHGPASIPD
ncbi:MAG: cupin domain-containing protein [Dehalococcoidia bacterium]|nr:MAG: cupin domain-containing protein [Dehalococcoidia bacterium]